MSMMMVFYQDIKDRMVYWFLFPIIAICSGVLLFNSMMLEVFTTTLIINLCFISILILVVYGYSKFKLKTAIGETFGLGDALLFIALAFTFSSISFIVLFVFGLIFSLVLHLLLKSKSKHQNVPLAGYLSLFFIVAYISQWLGIVNSLYTY